LKSTDKGLTWTVSQVPGVTDIQRMAYSDANNGIIQQISYNQTTGALQTFTMKRTTDGGTTWQTLDTTGIFKTDIAAVPGVPGMYITVGAQSGRSGSGYSVDHGDTWTVIDEDIQYISVRFLNEDIGYAGGFSLNAQTGGIYKWNGLTKVECAIGPYCPGDAFDANLTLSRNQDPGNVFTVQLSDKHGNFNNPTNIGTLTSSTSDLIPVVLPADAQAGTAYRIRVVMSSPADTTADNGRNITILGLPNAIAGQDVEICYASSLTLSGIAQSYNSANWVTNGTGAFDDAQLLNATYTPSVDDSTAGSVVLVLEATSVCGTAADSITVTLSTNATAFTGLDASVCLGSSTQLIANGGYAYQWQADPTLSATDIANPIATPTETTTYQVEVTSECGTAQASVTVSVLSLPDAEITTVDETTICSGQIANLTVSTTGAGYSYQWYIDGYELNAETALTYVATGSGNFTAEVIDQNGCSSMSNTITIEVAPAPNAAIIISDTEFCDGESATITAPNNANYTYTWYNGPTVITGQTSNVLTVTESGSYMLNVVDNVSTCYANSNSVDITVHPNPAKPTVNWNGTVLISSALSGNQWYLNGSIINGATTKNYQPTVNGTYSVQVTDPATGCISEMSDTINIYTFNVNDIDFANSIRIYPNPSTGNFNIEVDGGNASVTIMNVLGEVVKSFEMKTGQNASANIKLNVADGVYFVRIVREESIHTVRMIIGH